MQATLGWRDSGVLAASLVTVKVAVPAPYSMTTNGCTASCAPQPRALTSEAEAHSERRALPGGKPETVTLTTSPSCRLVLGEIRRTKPETVEVGVALVVDRVVVDGEVDGLEWQAETTEPAKTIPRRQAPNHGVDDGTLLH